MLQGLSRAAGDDGTSDMADLAGGVISLVVAVAFLAILVYAVPSVPLWIVVLVGVALMVVSLVESLRGNESR